MKEDENVMNEVIKYLDTLIITINSGLNVPLPDQHLCQKNKNEQCNN